MATFQDEVEGDQPWDRILELTAFGKTVEVYRKAVGGEQVRVLRIWSGKRADGSNKVQADPNAEY